MGGPCCICVCMCVLVLVPACWPVCAGLAWPVLSFCCPVLSVPCLCALVQGSGARDLRIPAVADAEPGVRPDEGGGGGGMPRCLVPAHHRGRQGEPARLGADVL